MISLAPLFVQWWRACLSVCTLWIAFANTAVAQQSVAPAVPAQIHLMDLDIEFDQDARQQIQKEVNKLWANRYYLERLAEKARMHFPLIEDILKEEQVPLDLKYLAVQESSLRGNAVSSAQAVGYWQMKEAAAREVGLRIDDSIDERMHLVHATRGAARYLKKHYALYRNWAYAVIAYYTGAFGAKPYTDARYYGANAMKIRGDTHWYLLRFIAHKIALEELVGAQAAEPVLTAVAWAPDQVPRRWEALAPYFQTDAATLAHHNPWLKQSTLPGDDTYLLIVPLRNEQIAQLEVVYPRTSSSTPAAVPATGGFAQRKIVTINGMTAVIAQENDTAESLARLGGISVDDFYAYNDLPEGAAIQANIPYFFTKKRKKTEQLYHIVQGNESLWKISQQYGVRYKKLLKRNRMKKDEPLQKGRVIWLRYKRPRHVPIEVRE
ncbi:transglycosylase SLT domain-containing protein [Thermonema rossianum]|uniref:transglycosylase SLT domain-containing protein n=1 Tax=Thermonema rossianum TaxID=55505 RepID=UPI00146FA440|nr:transglycosylase SLT domain-containing protein [Thermonema rossianum]